jgi:hypothetical protein
MTTTTDQQNIALAWTPGLLSAQDVTEIYTGTQPQQIAWLYNAVVAAVRARCTRMQQEKASQIELVHIHQQEQIRMGQDLATKMEIERISGEDLIECQVYGVLVQMIEQIATQVAPPEEQSQEVLVRVPTYAEQAWEALKKERERKKNAAVAHAAMLQTHSEARERKNQQKHERQAQHKLRMGQDLATKMDQLIAEEDQIKGQVYGVLIEMLDQIGTQIAHAQEKEVPDVGHRPTTKPKRKSRLDAAQIAGRDAKAFEIPRRWGSMAEDAAAPVSLHVRTHDTLCQEASDCHTLSHSCLGCELGR